MRNTLVIALLGVVTASEEMTSKFMQYLSQQNKSYGSVEEFEMRLHNFFKTDEFIQKWNANKENTSTVGHN